MAPKTKRVRLKAQLEREAAELVCVAFDYLSQHWDMDSEPLNKIKRFTTAYLKSVGSNKTYSGRILLRISPDEHRRIVSAAAKDGKSVNTWILNRLSSNAPLSGARNGESK